jgi:hypothetical protein
MSNIEVPQYFVKCNIAAVFNDSLDILVYCLISIPSTITSLITKLYIKLAFTQSKLWSWLASWKSRNAVLLAHPYPFVC